MFDMLVEGKELSKAERGLVKQVARELLDALKAEKLRIELWAEKEATRAEVKHLHPRVAVERSARPAAELHHPRGRGQG